MNRRNVVKKSQDQEEGASSIHAEEEKEDHDQQQDVMSFIAGIAGNMLEWYDFSIFGYLSDIIGDEFFPPNQGGHATLIESFAVFGGAFLMRPIGGAVIGRIGDIFGRRRAVMISILLMVIPTVAIGFLPTYKQCGWVAPILLLIMRCLQGFSAGGQLMSSVVLTLEQTDEKKWGVYGSSVFVVASLGVTIGSLVSYVLREFLLTDDQLRSWGWRLPFWLGIFGIIPGIYLRLREQETSPPQSGGEEKEEEAPSGKEKNSLLEAISPSNRRALFASMLVPTFPAAAYYISYVWLPVYFETIIKVPHAFLIATITGVLGMVFNISGGLLSDHYTSSKYVVIMVISSACMAIMGPVFLTLVNITSNKDGNNENNTTLIIVCSACQITFAFCLSIWNGSMIPWMVHQFPPHVRLTSVNIGYNVAMSICGGFAPAIATLMVDKVSNTSPGYMLTAVAFLSWIGLCIAPPSPSSNEEESTEIKCMVSSNTEIT